MITKVLILSFVLLNFAVAQDTSELLARLVDVRGAAENPCGGIIDPYFVRSYRGCAWYTVCFNNAVVREDRCPEGLRFNYAEQLCDFTDNVECDLDDRWRSLTCPTGATGIAVIPHPYVCSKYTVCFNGVQNDRDCPPGLHFSYYDNDCVTPFLANCDLDYHLCENSREVGLPTFHANSRNCESYFLCVGETAVTLKCEPGSHFDIRNNWCTDKETAECESIFPDNPPSIPDQIFIDCGDANGLSIPHPESCQFFFFCAEGRSFLQMCGEGLIFDIYSGICQREENARCIIEPPPTVPTEEPVETTVVEEETTVVEEETTVLEEETTVVEEETTVVGEETTVVEEATTIEPVP